MEPQIASALRLPCGGRTLQLWPERQILHLSYGGGSALETNMVSSCGIRFSRNSTTANSISLRFLVLVVAVINLADVPNAGLVTLYRDFCSAALIWFRWEACLERGLTGTASPVAPLTRTCLGPRHARTNHQRRVGALMAALYERGPRGRRRRLPPFLRLFQSKLHKTITT